MANDIERDEPIAELRGLSVDTSADFTARLQRRIERREAANHLLWYSWHLPVAVFLSFLEVTFALFGSEGSDGGGST